MKSTFFWDDAVAGAAVDKRFGVAVEAAEMFFFFGDRRIRDLDDCFAGVGSPARLFVEFDRVRPCFTGDVADGCLGGSGGRALLSCTWGSFAGDSDPSAADCRGTHLMDLTPFDCGSADGFTGVDEPPAARAAEAFVGERRRLETGRGRAVESLEETCSLAASRNRFAGASDSCAVAAMVLKGLTEAGLPVTGGGMRVEELVPAVLGRSGSSRLALELVRFSDWAVGRVNPGRARKEEG